MASKNYENTLQLAGKPPSVGGDAPLPTGDGHGREDQNQWRENLWNRTTAAAIPSLSACFKTTLGVTVALYILNQKHLLPRPLSAIVSQVLFWPTIPITVSRRIGRWETVVDDTVIVGGAPFGFAKLPEKLYETYGVSERRGA